MRGASGDWSEVLVQGECGVRLMYGRSPCFIYGTVRLKVSPMEISSPCPSPVLPSSSPCPSLALPLSSSFGPLVFPLSSHCRTVLLHLSSHCPLLVFPLSYPWPPLVLPLCSSSPVLVLLVFHTCPPLVPLLSSCCPPLVLIVFSPCLLHVDTNLCLLTLISGTFTPISCACLHYFLGMCTLIAYTNVYTKWLH